MASSREVVKSWSVYETVGYAILSHDLCQIADMASARALVVQGTHRWVLGEGSTLRCGHVADPLGPWEHELEEQEDGHFHAR